MHTPEISVVMSVYNDARYLRKSLESILLQEDVDFEFIIINDGSTDESGKILDEYAGSDKRILVIEQKNAGLTKALIRGCAKARGKYIARQDVGDYSLPNRLADQKKILESNRDAVVVVSGVRQFLPDGRIVGEIWPSAHGYGMKNDWREAGMGIPAHGCVMFRRDSYLAIGGYRDAFYYAQDRDLWLRMNRLGALACVRKIIYELLFEVEGISSSRCGLQKKFSDLADRCFQARNTGRSEDAFLERARILAHAAAQNGKKKGERYYKAGSYYRLASTLESHNRELSREFYRRSFHVCPYYWRTWRKLFSLFRSQT